VIEVDKYVGEYHEREDLGGGFTALEAFTHLLLHILIYLKLLIEGIKCDPIYYRTDRIFANFPQPDHNSKQIIKKRGHLKRYGLA
jgi:hypothetical protein